VVVVRYRKYILVIYWRRDPTDSINLSNVTQVGKREISFDFLGEQASRLVLGRLFRSVDYFKLKQSQVSA
jgi:hypothetical protein